MAREIIVKTWCDLHLHEGEHVEGEEIPPSTLLPGKPRILALCDVHRKEIYDPLIDALTEFGQPVDGKPVASSSRRGPHPQGGDIACPVDGCPYPGARTRDALAKHTRAHHNATPTELEVHTRDVCPECGREFTTPQGLGAHRFRAHGIRRKETTDTSSGPLTCPECGKHFTAAKGLGAHRSRTHGIPGTSKSARNTRKIVDE